MNPAPLMVWLSACGASRDFAGTLLEDQTFSYGGVERTYHLYLPPEPTSGPSPTVILLHGGGARIDDVLGLHGTTAPFAAWLTVADREGVVLIVPQGLDHHWNDCRADCTRCPDSDDAGFLLALVDELTPTHGLDPERLFAQGESNGGFMSMRLAQEHADRFAAVGVVNASLPAQDGCAPASGRLSIAWMAGTADQAIPWAGGEGSGGAGSGTFQPMDDALEVWRTRLGCDDAPQETAVQDLDPDDGSTASRRDWTCAEGASLRFWTVDGGGHVPPSITEQVSTIWEGIVGPQNHDLEMAEEMWAAFSAVSR
ncbi:MAG: prolyl oligopeptidase family serine peptidase [Myxococcales bacterium]|nr:prolyl oligopeptidase family serine peptidase [Myxococcales bacterium]